MSKALYVVLFCLVAFPVFGHDWYDRDCCSDRDCFHEKDGQEVTGEPVPGGYKVSWNGKSWVFDEAQVRRSHDGRYHICILSYADDMSGAVSYAPRPLCVYVPSAGL